MYSLSIYVSPDVVRAREWLCLVGLFCGVNLESLLMATSPLSILNIMHPRRLTNTFVVRFWESIISKLATSKISFFHLVSVAEESSLSFALPETQKTVISSIPNYFNNSETPIICYKYNKPIRSTIFNFNKIINDLDIDSNTPAS